MHAYDLEALATRVRRLTVHHRDPERFHVEKSEIVHELHKLVDAIGDRRHG